MVARTWLALLGVAVTAWSVCAQEGSLPVPAAASGAQRLTLEEARERALSHNRQLELGRLNVREKQIAVSAAKRDYFPKVLGLASYLRFDEPLGSVVTTRGRQRGGQTVQILPRGPGVRIPTITVPAQSTAVNVLNQDTAIGTVMVAQPVTKLIGVSALVDLARADAGIAEAQLDKGTRELLSGVAQAYYALHAARRIKAALSLQSGMLDKLLEIKPSAELRLASLELRKGLVEADKQIAELSEVLAQLLGLPPGTCLELVEPALPPVTVTCADEAAQQALVNHPQVREAQQGITKARAGLRAAKMEYLPDVNVVGGYGGQTAADYIQDNFAYVGVTASYTFWDWGKRREVKRQRETQIAMAHHNVDVMIETVQLDARKAFLAYKQAEEESQIAGEVVKARQDAEKEAKDPQAMLTTKAATAKAQLEQMQAELNYRLAHAKLLAAVGCP
jgi:outer membrane protein TolC